MWITAEVENFRPKNFEIHNFYGTETCFAWQNNLMVVFPYARTVSTPKLPLVVAPREIECVRSFGGRVFVVCRPSGVYKFMQQHKFSILSSTAVAIGPAYYQVYSPDNDWLYLKDKSAKTDKQLFPLRSTSENATTRICDISLTSTNSDITLRKSLHQPADGGDDEVCIIANGRKVFEVTRQEVQIVYRAERDIVDIVGIYNEDIIVGFVLVSTDSAVLAYVAKDKLVFDKVFLDSEVRGLCAGTTEGSRHIIWIAHTDGENIYYSAKNVACDSFRRTGTESKRCVTIRNYKGRALIGLTEGRQLIECDVEALRLGKDDTEEFYDLKPNMLNGAQRLVEEICEKAKRLQSLNESLAEEQEKLKRINIYSHKQAIVHLPNVRVCKFADRCFLRIKFDGVLPMDCRVIAILRSDRRVAYCMKHVEDAETVVDVPVDADSLRSTTTLGVDLVTLAEESRAWCLVRNYTKSPNFAKTTRIKNERRTFLEAKLAALRGLTSDGSLDMRKLSAIKKSVRREIVDA